MVASNDALFTRVVIFRRYRMTIGTLRFSRDDPNAWRVPVIGLFVAAAIVAIAIVVGGSTARALNGVGGLLWIASGVLLGLSVPSAPRQLVGWTVAVLTGLILAGIIRPGTIGAATVAFAIAGAVVVFAAGDRSGIWAFLAPAIYLPVHLLIGIGRALSQGGSIRAEPPPTAAVVPLTMLLAAAAGGAIAASLLRRGRSG
jgi:hypothetical protein